MSTKRGDGFARTPDTLRKAILSMQRKITKCKADFLAAPLTIEAEMGDGRIIERPNPLVQEYRSLVRDYAAALKSYKELTNDKDQTEEVNRLVDIRTRFKVAK